MARRLVLNARDGELTFEDFLSFTKKAQQMGLEKSASIDVTVYRDGEEVHFGVTIPNDRLPTGEKIKPKKLSKKQKAVQKQIAEHKAKKAKGIAEAYVPPVGHTGPPKPAKIKCPVCNVRKQIRTVAGVKTIKPHVSKGDPCSGSGVQVRKAGKLWKVV